MAEPKKSWQLAGKVPCIHLGPPTGETCNCDECGGGAAIVLRHCALHGRCTADRILVYKEGPAGPLIQVKWCLLCDDYPILFFEI